MTVERAGSASNMGMLEAEGIARKGSGRDMGRLKRETMWPHQQIQAKVLHPFSMKIFSK